MAALIDEYKQAIQDVLDGRAKPAPKPSELPWTEDKLASMWAAAAAELIAEENSGGSSGGGVLVVNMANNETGELDKTWKEISDAGFSVLKNTDGAETSFAAISTIGYDAGGNQYYVTYGDGSFVANSQTDYPAWS